MSGHEFEKQVRQELNDLKLTPTSKVWENIEENLRERRRRPAVIYWLPLLLIGLGAAGYLFFRSTVDNVVATVTKVEQTSTASQDNKYAPQVNAPQTSSPQVKKDIPSVDLLEGEKKKPNNSLVTRQVISIKGAQENMINGQQAKAPQASSPQGKKDLGSAGVLQDEEKTPENSLNETQENALTTPQTKAPQAKAQQENKITTPVASPPKKLKNKFKHWSYGISASSGLSAVNEGKLLGFNNAQVEDVSIVAAFAPSPTYKPSTISPGFTYSAGMFAKTNLSKKFSLSLGLNYLQLNTRNKVGYQMTGRAIVNNGNSGYLSISNYFTIDRDNTKEYRNRYHFIEFPIELHTSINHSKKLPINITTGVAVSRLIKSNSLHFDGTTGVYYQNDKLLNRTQFAARAGLTFGVLNKTKRPLWIGPSMNYNISKILKKDVSTRKNFMSFGIDAKMFIKR
jgi:hypothetical protein